MPSSRHSVAAVLGLALLTAAPASPGEAAEPPATGPAPGLDLEALRGQVVYLDFWASWCGPCRKSFPWLNEMQHKYGEKGLVVIGVNVDRERKAADAFLEKYSPGFRIVYDPKGELAGQYDLKGMPATFVFGRDGKRALTHVGFRESETAEMEQHLRELLAVPAEEDHS